MLTKFWYFVSKDKKNIIRLRSKTNPLSPSNLKKQKSYVVNEWTGQGWVMPAFPETDSLYVSKNFTLMGYAVIRGEK